MPAGAAPGYHRFMSQEERSGARAKVEGLRVKYKSATIDAFLDDAFDDLGAGGMFIRTETPFPVTTLLKFEVQISNSEVALSGVGRVAWIRTKAQSDAQSPAGMGVKFIKVDDRSKQVIEAVVMRGAAGEDYVKGVRDSIRVAQLEQEQVHSMSPPVNPTIVSVPPPASRDALRERNNTLVGIGSPSAAPPRSVAPGAHVPMIVPTPTIPPDEEPTTRTLTDSAAPSTFNVDAATEVWRKPDATFPSEAPLSAAPVRIMTPSSLRPARLSTPAPPLSAFPHGAHQPDAAHRSQPSFRAPTMPPPKRSSLWSAVAWGFALVGLGALGFWFGTRGSVEHVEPKADIIRPAAEVPEQHAQMPALPSERLIAIQTPDASVLGIPQPVQPQATTPVRPAQALVEPVRATTPTAAATEKTPVQDAPKSVPATVPSTDAVPVQTAPSTPSPEAPPAKAAPATLDAAPKPVVSAPKSSDAG